MIRRAALVLLALVAGCAAPHPPETACRIGPDGGPPPPLAAAAPIATTATADRGIGGTGVRTAKPVAVADRGIGGTGIVGTITGFASICLAGVAVTVDPEATVQIDGAAAKFTALRVGEVAAVVASGPRDALRAQRVAVRHEVVGPVEAMAEPSGTMRIAGQNVRLVGGVRPAALVVGEWVAVSGLRDSDGAIVATRLDRAPAGEMQVSGVVRAERGDLWIGGLAVRGLAPSLAGQRQTVTGRYVNGGLLATKSVAAPSVPFGADVGRLVMQAYVLPAGSRLRLGEELTAALTPDLSARLSDSRWRGVWAFVDLGVTEGGGLTATSVSTATERGGGGEPGQPGAAAPDSGGHAGTGAASSESGNGGHGGSGSGSSGSGGSGAGGSNGSHDH